MVSERIERLKKRVMVDEIPFSVEKARLFTESYRRNEGMPEIIRTATAQAYMLDHFPVFIIEDELIAGNQAAKEMAVEADFWSKGTWTSESIESLREEKWGISDEQAELMYELSAYWRNIIMDYKALDLYDEELWAWKRCGFLLPSCETVEQAAGNGFACNGFGLFGDAEVNQIDYGYVMKKGIGAIIKEAEEELHVMMKNSMGSGEEIEKIYFLRAVIIIQKAFVRFAKRFASLAEKEAVGCGDAKRRKELERMAKACQQVPENPPRTFYEAVQFQWFLFLMLVTRNTTPLGRFDQYMYPYYKKDVESGVLTEDEAVELLASYRLKFMQFKTTSGGGHRKKWSGNARWNNMIIGGVKPDGSDASNELSFLILDAALLCPTPHHTISLRVHEKTPDKLLMKSLELVKTGIGMPAFLGDKSYIENLVQKGVPLEKARDYYIMGCIDPTVPEGFGFIFPTIVIALTLDTFMHNGYSRQQDMEIGLKTGDVCLMDTFDEFMDKYMEHIRYYLKLYAKDNNIRYETGKNILQDAFTASLFSDGIKVGKIGKKRKLPYGLGPTINVSVGAINIADSLYAIKKLVYEDKVITMKQLLDAMDADWQGEEHAKIRRMCLNVPKFGNDIPEVDSMAAEFYDRITKLCAGIPTYRGGTYNAAGVSITGHEPGGTLIGATPDGRTAGSILADGACSPEQGKDVSGPTAVMNSAMRIDQRKLQSLLFNMKFSAESLKSEEDMMKLGALIRTYADGYGKHVQFNVVNQETMIAAKECPQEHRDLIVRVAGYSAYFVKLSEGIQNELINRTSHQL